VAESAVVAGVVALAWAYAVGARRAWRAAGPGRIVKPHQPWCMAAGLVTVLVALSPIVDHRAAHSLTAHMTQHVLLLVVAAPLLVLGAPLPALLWAVPERWRPQAASAWRSVLRTQRGAGWARWIVAGLLLQAAAISVWHAPGPYQAAGRNQVLHAVEHASYLATATLFWWAVVAGRRSRFGAGVVALFVGSLPCTAVGALLTLADHPWYPHYVHGSVASALSDQQMAGVVMWAFGGMVYVVAAAALFASWLAGIERSMPARTAVAR
jgi:putative membrane protein